MGTHCWTVLMPAAMSSLTKLNRKNGISVLTLASFLPFFLCYDQWHSFLFSLSPSHSSWFTRPERTWLLSSRTGARTYILPTSPPIQGPLVSPDTTYEVNCYAVRFDFCSHVQMFAAHVATRQISPRRGKSTFSLQECPPQQAPSDSYLTHLL